MTARRKQPAARKPDYPGKPGVKPKLTLTPEFLAQCQKLGQLHATETDCAAYFDVSRRTWQEFVKLHGDPVREALEIGRGKGKVSLRRRMFEIAMSKTEKGAGAMAVWLSKQHLGMSEKVENTGADGAPLVPPSIRVTFVKPGDKVGK